MLPVHERLSDVSSFTGYYKDRVVNGQDGAGAVSGDFIDKPILAIRLLQRGEC